jgi:hypothetical protein
MSNDIALFRWRHLTKRNTTVSLGPGLDLAVDGDGFFPVVLAPVAEARFRELKAAGLQYERVAINSAAIWSEKLRVAQDEVNAATEAALRAEADLAASRGILRLAQERLDDVRGSQKRANDAWNEAAKAGGLPAA